MVLPRAQRQGRRLPLPLPTAISAQRRARNAFFTAQISHITTAARRGGLDARAQCIFLVQGSHLLLRRPFSRTTFPRTHTHARARTHTRARTTDDERRDVRPAGVTDWKTARGGNTERTLTA